MFRRLPPALLSVLLVLAVAAPDAAAQQADQDRHAGYYYPEPQSSETYVARARVLTEANRAARVGFVTGFTAKQLAQPAPPDFAIFAKGAEAQKLIIVALGPGRMDTLYRARAALAMLTAVARTMPIFQEYGVQDWFTFFDLAKMLGFTQITVSDGDSFAHRILID